MPNLRPIKAAEMTARRIIQEISDRALQPGDVLAPEAEMVRTYQVSRGTLREALRLLETQGLVFMKSGPSGGPVVGKADPFYLGRIATLFFRLAGGTYEDVAATLLLIEPLVARLAAERRDPEAAPRLMTALVAESCELAVLSTPPTPAMRKMNDLHLVLSSLCGNPILSLLSDALGSIFMEHIVAVSDSTGVLPHSHGDHVRIAEAVIKGDGAAAAACAEAHMRRLIDFHREQLPGVFAQPVRWR